MEILVSNALDCVWVFYLCLQLKYQISSPISVIGVFPEQVTRCPACSTHSIKVADREVTFRNKKRATMEGTQWCPFRAQKTGPSWVSSKARLIVQMRQVRPWRGGPMSCLQTLKSDCSKDHILMAFLLYTHLIINELQGHSWSMPFPTLSLNMYLEMPMTIYYTI